MNGNVRLQRNIPLFYAYQVLNFFVLDRGIWMLFLAAHGFSLTEIGLLESGYHLLVFVLEVPTGYIADKYGRKFSLLLGQLFGVAASALMLVQGGAPAIVVGFLLNSVSGVFQSGASGALVYETLKGLQRRSAFKKLNSHLASIALISMGLGGAAGGYLSDIHWDWVYAGKVVLNLATFVLLLGVLEPSLTASQPFSGAEEEDEDVLRNGEGSDAISVKRQAREVYRFLRSSRPFVKLAVYGAVLYSMSWSVAFYIQLIYQGVGYSNSLIGVINASETWISAAAAACAFLIERHLTKRGSLVLAGSAFVASQALLSGNTESYAAVAIYLASAVLISYLEPLLETYMHELVPSPMRATLLSVFNMTVSGGMMVTFSLIGILADHASIATALKQVMLVWVPVAALAIIWAARRDFKTPHAE
jgi:MFS family permease